jgi:hypothetical protein
MWWEENCELIDFQGSPDLPNNGAVSALTKNPILNNWGLAVRQVRAAVVEIRQSRICNQLSFLFLFPWLGNAKISQFSALIIIDKFTIISLEEKRTAVFC